MKHHKNKLKKKISNNSNSKSKKMDENTMPFVFNGNKQVIFSQTIILSSNILTIGPIANNFFQFAFLIDLENPNPRIERNNLPNLPTTTHTFLKYNVYNFNHILGAGLISEYSALKVGPNKTISFIIQCRSLDGTLNNMSTTVTFYISEDT